jgi:hypothetical protein
VGQCLFRVADVFNLRRVGRVVIATDCPMRSAPSLSVGDPIEFRNPDGSVFQSVVAGIELLDPPDPDRPLGFPLPFGTPAGAVQVGAEVWPLAEE